MQAGSKSPEQPNRPRATPNHAARALHDLGMEVDPSNRRPLERLAADLNGHVAEPFRSVLNSAVGAGTKDVPAPIVSIGPSGVGGEYQNEVHEPECDRCCDSGIIRVDDNGPGEPSCVVPCNCRNPVRVDLPKPAARGMTMGGFVNACGEAMGMPTTDPASKAIAATHPGITQREIDERTRRRVSRVRGQALCWPTVAEILNAPGRLTATLADLRQVEALRTAACCLEDKGPHAEAARQYILDQINQLDPASCPVCGIETEVDDAGDDRGPWRACVSCSWNNSTRNEGGGQ